MFRSTVATYSPGSAGLLGRAGAETKRRRRQSQVSEIPSQATAMKGAAVKLEKKE